MTEESCSFFIIIIEALVVSVPAIPPAPGGVSSSHPLLSRQNESQGYNTATGTRLQRSGRQRGTYRYNPNTQTLHVQYARARHPNPSAILQRSVTHNTSYVDAIWDLCISHKLGRLSCARLSVKYLC